MKYYDFNRKSSDRWSHVLRPELKTAGNRWDLRHCDPVHGYIICKGLHVTYDFAAWEVIESASRARCYCWEYSLCFHNKARPQSFTFFEVWRRYYSPNLCILLRLVTSFEFDFFLMIHEHSLFEQFVHSCYFYWFKQCH